MGLSPALSKVNIRKKIKCLAIKDMSSIQIKMEMNF